MNIGLIKRLIVAHALLVFYVLPCGAERWTERYIESLPDSAFASIEFTQDGKKIRHLPHHDHTGELDIDHLKSALGRIHQVKWVDPANFPEAKIHLEKHYREYKQKRAEAYGLQAPVNINSASEEELTKLPHIGKKRARSIIGYRKTHGGFKSVEEIRRVPGIGAEIFRDIESLITVE